MSRRGAEEALDLEGGGLSTMSRVRPLGRVGVIDVPSGEAGRQRPVIDGLQVTLIPAG